MKKIAFAVSLVALALPLFVAAHPGHGEHGGYTITHYFTEPVHAVVGISLLIAVFLVAVFLKGKKEHVKNNK
jgi:hypothetical protein